MDYAIITAKPAAIKKSSIGEIISSFEAKGFSVLDLTLLKMDQASYYESCEVADIVPTNKELAELLTGKSLILGVSHRDLPAAYKKEGLEALAVKMCCTITPGSKALVYWFGKLK